MTVPKEKVKIEKIVKKTISKILKIKIQKKHYNLKMGEIKNWDSLNQIKIYIELSKLLNYKGNIDRLAKVETIKDWIVYFNDRNN